MNKQNGRQDSGDVAPYRKALELTLLTPKKMVFNGGLSVVADLGP